MFYWNLYEINAYRTFHVFEDTGLVLFNMYYNIHFPSIVHGLQYSVIGNHNGFVQLFVLLIFYFFPYVETLFFVKVFVLEITGLVLFFVARDLIKSDGIALSLSILYFFNPGINAMMLSDYHHEIFFVLFYLLTFYFYMKENKKLCLFSLIFLLGTMELASIFAIALGLGLLAYEYLYDKNKKRIGLVYLMILFSLAGLVIYNLIYSQLSYSYQSAYQSLPQYIKLLPWPFVPPGTNIYGSSATLRGIDIFVKYSLMVALFSFGFYSLEVAITELIFIAPWLVALFTTSSDAFTALWQPHYSFVIGGIIAATILGIKKLKGLKRSKKKMLFLKVMSIISIISIFEVYPLYLHSKLINNYYQQFLFQTNPALQKYYAQLNSIIEAIPENATLMTQNFFMAYGDIAKRRYVEVLNPNLTYFEPEYILVDFEPNITLNIYGTDQQKQFFYNYTATHSYKIYLSNGSAILYQKS